MPGKVFGSAEHVKTFKYFELSDFILDSGNTPFKLLNMSTVAASLWVEFHSIKHPASM